MPRGSPSRLCIIGAPNFCACWSHTLVNRIPTNFVAWMRCSRLVAHEMNATFHGSFMFPHPFINLPPLPTVIEFYSVLTRLRFPGMSSVQYFSHFGGSFAGIRACGRGAGAGTNAALQYEIEACASHAAEATDTVYAISARRTFCPPTNRPAQC